MNKINETVRIKIPYTETSYGTIYFKCVKEKNQTDAEFIDTILKGDFDPFLDNCDEDWDQEDSDSLIIHHDDVELD